MDTLWQFPRLFLKSLMAHTPYAFCLHRAGRWSSDMMTGVGADISGHVVTVRIEASMAERHDKEGLKEGLRM